MKCFTSFHAIFLQRISLRPKRHLYEASNPLPTTNLSTIGRHRFELSRRQFYYKYQGLQNATPVHG